MPCLGRLCLKLREQGSGPEGVNDLCFHTYGEFSLSPSSDWAVGLGAGFQVLRLGFVPWGWDLGPNAGFWALRLGFGPQDWDLGLKTKTWASRLGFEGGRKKKERSRRRRRRRRKFPICVKAKVIDRFGAAALLPLQLQAQPTKAGHGYR